MNTPQVKEITRAIARLMRAAKAARQLGQGSLETTLLAEATSLSKALEDLLR